MDEATALRRVHARIGQVEGRIAERRAFEADPRRGRALVGPAVALGVCILVLAGATCQALGREEPHEAPVTAVPTVIREEGFGVAPSRGGFVLFDHGFATLVRGSMGGFAVRAYDDDLKVRWERFGRLEGLTAGSGNRSDVFYGFEGPRIDVLSVKDGSNRSAFQIDGPIHHICTDATGRAIVEAAQNFAVGPSSGPELTSASCPIRNDLPACLAEGTNTVRCATNEPSKRLAIGKKAHERFEDERMIFAVGRFAEIDRLKTPWDLKLWDKRDAMELAPIRMGLDQDAGHEQGGQLAFAKRRIAIVYKTQGHGWKIVARDPGAGGQLIWSRDLAQEGSELVTFVANESRFFVAFEDHIDVIEASNGSLVGTVGPR